MPSITAYETAAGKRYRVRYRKPDRSQTDKRGFKTKREAEMFLATVEVSKMRGEWVDPSRSQVAVAGWAEGWYQAQVQLKPTTRSGYRHGLDKHVLPRWGTTRLVDVAHGDVQTWVNKLSTHLAPSTVRQTFLVLSGVLKFAVRDGRLAKNPCDGVRLPRVVRSERGYLSHEQVGALAEAAGQYGDLVRFLSYTGLRWGEMAALKVGRVDMLRRRAEIAEAVSEPRGQVIWGTPKGHERRSVPVPRFVLEDISKRCHGKHRDDLVFTAPTGGVLRSGNFRRSYFNPALAAVREADADFPKVTPHDLRHTAASLAISAGANVKAVQRMLGHASAAMTLDVYADLFDDDLDAVAEALDSRAAISVVGKVWAEGDNVSPLRSN